MLSPAMLRLISDHGAIRWLSSWKHTKRAVQPPGQGMYTLSEPAILQRAVQKGSPPPLPKGKDWMRQLTAVIVREEKENVDQCHDERAVQRLFCCDYRRSDHLICSLADWSTCEGSIVWNKNKHAWHEQSPLIWDGDFIPKETVALLCIYFVGGGGGSSSLRQSEWGE